MSDILYKLSVLRIGRQRYKSKYAKVNVLQILIVKSKVGPLSERKPNIRIVNRLYYRYWQYANLFIFQYTLYSIVCSMKRLRKSLYRTNQTTIRNKPKLWRENRLYTLLWRIIVSKQTTNLNGTMFLFYHLKPTIFLKDLFEGVPYQQC